GVIGVLEFAPNDRFSSSLDVFYSQFKNHQIQRGIELPLVWGGVPLTNATVKGGFVTAGTFNGVKGVVRNDGNDRDSTIKSLGWNNKLLVGDAWTLTSDVSWSKVDRTDMILETYAGTGRAGTGATDNLSFTMNGDGVAIFKSTLNYADPSVIKLTSSQGWGGDIIAGGQDGYLNKPTVQDELKALRLDAKRDLDSGLSSLQFGMNYSERSKSLVNDEFFLRVKGSPASVSIPSSALVGATSLAFIGIAGMVSYDPFALINNGTYDLVRNPNADVLVKSWDVEEKVTVGYLKANIDAAVGDVPVTGNFGFQLVNTDQSSTALGASGSGSGAGVTRANLSGGKTYVDFLPSMNLQFRLPNEQSLRFALSRTLARPRMDQMRASKTFSYDAAKAGSTDVNFSPWSGKGGNPELEPWRANSVDVSYEKYFGRQAYVSLAAFYKDLKTYVYDENVVFDFTGFPTGGNLEPAIRKGIVTTPQNGKGGSIKGVEFAASIPGSLLTPVLDGFGAQFSASSTKSSIQPNAGDPTQEIPGLSKTVANLTVYYEKHGFSARVSERYRSKFLGEVSGFGNGRNYRMVKGETIVDGQLGYSFTDGPLDGLSALFQVNNLTDEPFTTYQGEERQVIDFQRYGRTYLVGLSYKF
ncbi:MAG: TonB-dependent receptor, partial [bacterium]|nr:TonB-dependent receptor [bacterium]